MQHALLIAEKPDLMRKIEAVYQSNKASIPYDITFVSQRGHLIALKNPGELDESLKEWTWDNLPIEPEKYGGFQYKIIEEKKGGKYQTSQGRYKEIERELKSKKYDFVIHAGDPDQEGELLVREVLSYAKSRLPVKRFWTNDLTESHILNALQNLKDDDADPMLTNLLSAAYGRQHSDWRFGMNITRASSIRMNGRVTCGRVKTPILAIVVKREDEIRNFKPKTVYGIKAAYQEGFDGTYFDQGRVDTDENAPEDAKQGVVWFDTKQEAEDLIKSLPDKASVVSFQTKRTQQYAPKLYKLATLQIEAGRHGYNDKQTLDIIQRLYEQEYLSYPRTDCEYLSSNEDFKGILREMAKIPEVSSYIHTITSAQIAKTASSKRWINDKALEDSGHSALRPTTKAPDLSKLTQAEKDIYLMVVKRFVAIFLPPIVQDKTQLIAEADGKTFRSNGSVLVDKGFAAMLDKEFKDTTIPKHEKGDVLDVKEYTVEEKTSTCPSRYTSPGLIAVCENPLKFLNDEKLKALGKKLKIGTPATRSAIIRQLIDVDKYLAEKKSGKTTYIIPTPAGEAIIKNLDGLMITRVDMTGLWEEQLEKIRTGEEPLSDFDDYIRESVRDMVAEIKAKPMAQVGRNGVKKEIGVCPKCGKPVYETEKGIFCTNYKTTCPAIFKELPSAGIRFDFGDFSAFAKGETVTKEDKAGKQRTFLYNFETHKMQEKGQETDIVCPVCGKKLQETAVSYICSCGFRCMKTIAGHNMTKEDMESIAEKQETDLITDFISKAGKPFSATLKLGKDDHLEFAFPEPESTETGYMCPCCKKKKLKETDRTYQCDCGFKIWKTIAGHKVQPEDVEALSENGKTELIEGFQSKKGRAFSAILVVNKRKKALDFKFAD